MTEPPLTLLLNLRSRPDRLELAQGRCRSVGLEPEVFYALTPADLRARGTTWDVGLPPGQAACTASHLEMLQVVVDRDVDHALILEDDVLFEPDFVRSFEAAMAALPAEWDFVQVGWVPTFDEEKLSYRVTTRLAALPPARRLAHLVKPSVTIEPSPVPHKYPSNGTHCYLVSREFAERVARLQGSHIFFQADLLMRWIVSSTPLPRSLKYYRCRFPLARQDWDLGSDVDPERFKGNRMQFDSSGRLRRVK